MPSLTTTASHVAESSTRRLCYRTLKSKYISEYFLKGCGSSDGEYHSSISDLMLIVEDDDSAGWSSLPASSSARITAEHLAQRTSSGWGFGFLRSSNRFIITSKNAFLVSSRPIMQDKPIHPAWALYNISSLGRPGLSVGMPSNISGCRLL